MKKAFNKNLSVFILVTSLLTIKNINGNAQIGDSLFWRDSLIAAAREIITSSKYCALVTVDSAGQPQVRTMNPFPLGDEIEVWFATSRTSRKVNEIKNDPRVCVYYADHSKAKGYVNIIGNAEIIDDKDLLVSKKREYWVKTIPNWQDIFVLIKITPETMDVINYGRGINGEQGTNRAPVVVF